jgi:hypothetical protein
MAVMAVGNRWESRWGCEELGKMVWWMCVGAQCAKINENLNALAPPDPSTQQSTNDTMQK